MYKTIQSALHKIKALQQGAEKALKICKIIERNNLNELKLIKTSNSLDK